jgi:hypothetical protein
MKFGPLAKESSTNRTFGVEYPILPSSVLNAALSMTSIFKLKIKSHRMVLYRQ